MHCACTYCCCLCDYSCNCQQRAAHACDPEIQLEAFFATASSYIQTEAEHWHEHSYQYDPLNKPEEIARMTAAFSARDVDAAAYATFGYLTAVVKDVENLWNTHIKLDAG
eukprot:848-Heterococcus_DN1.PRE.1